MTEPSLVEVYRAKNIAQAQLLQQQLADAGIHALIDNDNLQDVLGEVPAWNNAPRIMVESTDAPIARAVLQQAISGDRLSRRSRVCLGAGYFVICAVLVAGLVLFWPYLWLEHHRLDPAVAALSWVGDLTIFFWFTRFFIRHAIRGEPFRSIPWPEFRERRLGLSSAATITAALVVDLGATFYTREQDRAGHARAIVAVGTVEEVHGNKGHGQFELRGWYADQQGQRHEFRQPVLLGIPNGLWPHPALLGGREQLRPWPLSREAEHALRKGRLPFPFPIAYDPEMPSRNWIVAIPWSEINRYHHLGWVVLIMQMCIVPFWWFAFCVFIPLAVTQALERPPSLTGIMVY